MRRVIVPLGFTVFLALLCVFGAPIKAAFAPTPEQRLMVLAADLKISIADARYVAKGMSTARNHRACNACHPSTGTRIDKAAWLGHVNPDGKIVTATIGYHKYGPPKPRHAIDPAIMNLLERISVRLTEVHYSIYPATGIIVAWSALEIVIGPQAPVPAPAITPNRGRYQRARTMFADCPDDERPKPPRPTSPVVMVFDKTHDDKLFTKL
jgi:hypothetical protein